MKPQLAAASSALGEPGRDEDSVRGRVYGNLQEICDTIGALYESHQSPPGNEAESCRGRY